ncbi:hypothetical protein NDU88_001630 [Pleurodeles waltl]|uniref:Uncharacterized protein n=1 Tax=Pleurodeles waltl TaxID=8319 RepID=A0AAV7W0J3_PLEWA|nr:hypothetical protein NDU88_001630 [Pleurodeles waltl]
MERLAWYPHHRPTRISSPPPADIVFPFSGASTSALLLYQLCRGRPSACRPPDRNPTRRPPCMQSLLASPAVTDSLRWKPQFLTDLGGGADLQYLAEHLFFSFFNTSWHPIHWGDPTSPGILSPACSPRLPRSHQLQERSRTRTSAPPPTSPVAASRP